MKYLYIAALTLFIAVMVDVIDTQVPNGLGYYVGLIMPF